MVRHGCLFPVRLVTDITKEKVQEAVDEMGAGKAHGVDGVARDEITIVEWLVRLLLLCFE